jgi:hypothetical protein
MAPLIFNVVISYRLVASYTPRTICLSTNWVWDIVPVAGPVMSITAGCLTPWGMNPRLVAVQPADKSIIISRKCEHMNHKLFILLQWSIWAIIWPKWGQRGVSHIHVVRTGHAIILSYDFLQQEKMENTLKEHRREVQQLGKKFSDESRDLILKNRALREELSSYNVSVNTQPKQCSTKGSCCHTITEWEMSQTKVVEEIKSHVLCFITFFFFQKSCPLWDNV